MDRFQKRYIIVREESEFRRYQRINPKLGYRVARLDDKEKLESLQYTIRENLRNNEPYRKKISRIAHRLVASSFYFERIGQRKYGSGYACDGKITCRFPNGTAELRHLGSFLRLHQRHGTFQPYFSIQEQYQGPIENTIDPLVIEKMCTHAYFDMGVIEVNVSAKHGAITISLALWDFSEREDIIPMSGLSRNLLLDNLQRGTSPDMSATSPKFGFAHHRDPTVRTGRQREVAEDRPTFLFGPNTGDDESDAASVDLRRDAGDWLERRADLPRTTHPPSRLWPLLTPKNPLQSFRRLPRVAGISDLMSTEGGLRIFPEPPALPAIELEGSPIPTEAQDDENDGQEDHDEDQIPKASFCSHRC